VLPKYKECRLPWESYLTLMMQRKVEELSLKKLILWCLCTTTDHRGKIYQKYRKKHNLDQRLCPSQVFTSVSCMSVADGEEKNQVIFPEELNNVDVVLIILMF